MVLPSGDRSKASGSSPSGMRRSDLPVAGSITSAAFDSLQASMIRRSVVSWMCRPRLQVGIVPLTLSVARSINVIAGSFSLET